MAKLDVQDGEITRACDIHIVEQLRPGTDRTESLFRYDRLILKQQRHTTIIFRQLYTKESIIMSIIFPPKLYIGPFNTVKTLWVKYEIANMAMVSINVCTLLVNVF